jgi:sec-independent protein translocase protein TatB
MDILGIGIPELIFILVILLVVMGPDDMVKTGRVIGKFVRQIVRSDAWMAIRRTSKELREIPTRLVREAGLDELEKIQKDLKADVDSIVNVQTDLVEEVEQIKRDLPKQKIEVDLGIEAWTKPTSEPQKKEPPSQEASHQES